MNPNVSVTVLEEVVQTLTHTAKCCDGQCYRSEGAKRLIRELGKCLNHEQ